MISYENWDGTRIRITYRETSRDVYFFFTRTPPIAGGPHAVPVPHWLLLVSKP